MMSLLGQVWEVVQALLDVFCCFERCLAWGSKWIYVHALGLRHVEIQMHLFWPTE